MKKLRHAIYYDNRYGRNDGPPLYYFNVMKKKLEWDVTHLIPIGDTQGEFGNFDYHWWVDWGEDGLMQYGYKEWYPPQDGGKTIYVSSDTHLDNGYRLEKAKHFDYVFFNQQRALEKYRREIYGGLPKFQKIAWLPHAAEPEAYPKFEILKKYDVGFIGHVQETPNEFFHNMTRLDVLEEVFKAFPNFYFGTRNPAFPQKNMFEDASKRFGESKIVVNYSIKDDINMRFFETLSSGAFLLTNDLPTIDKIGLIPGKHFETYRNMKELKEKIKYYLVYEEEREKIALAGHKAFLRGHTYQHRIETVMKVIKGS